MSHPPGCPKQPWVQVQRMWVLQPRQWAGSPCSSLLPLLFVLDLRSVNVNSRDVEGWEKKASALNLMNNWASDQMQYFKKSACFHLKKNKNPGFIF